MTGLRNADLNKELAYRPAAIAKRPVFGIGARGRRSFHVDAHIKLRARADIIGHIAQIRADMEVIAAGVGNIRAVSAPDLFAGVLDRPACVKFFACRHISAIRWTLGSYRAVAAADSGARRARWREGR